MVKKKMNWKTLKTKIAAFLICTVVTASCYGAVVCNMPAKHNVVMAETTIADLESQKEQNNAEIAELEKKLSNIQGDTASQEEYQKQLEEKINLQSENIRLVSEQIDALNNDIASKQESINNLEVEIEEQQKNIDEGMEQFKLRIRAMYVSGNDSLASVLVGATDFYDVLSKMQLVTRVAKRDDELINDLTNQLNEYNNNVNTLQSEKSALETELQDADAKKSEYQEKFNQLNADAEKTQAEIDKLSDQKSSISSSIEQKKSENEVLDQKSSEIEAEIKRQQALREEQERAAAEKAAADKAAAEKAAAQESANKQVSQSSDEEDEDNNSGSSSSESTSNDDSNSGSSSSGSGSSSSNGSFCWPVPSSYYITSYFGERWGTFHKGIDIGAGNGTPIVAAASGTVIMAYNGCTHDYGKDSSCGCGGGYGNYIVIDNGGSYSTLYGHCSSVAVSEGDYVNQGDVIGYVGSTGYSTGNHLHFEIRVDGSQVDPLSYLGY